jgi:DNA replication protein DnaC
MMGSVQRPEAEKGQTAQAGGRNMPYAARTAPEICPICKGRGFLVYDVPAGDPNFNRVVPCRCTEAKLAAEHARGLRSVSNLGALERMTFDSFVPDAAGLPEGIRRDLHTVYELSLSFAREPDGWLVLMGGYGAGKTHLAAAIANHRVALGHPVLFVVVPDLLDYLRATFSPSSDAGLDERMETIREIPLLILDDLGAHNSTPWAQEKLFQILNHRYNNRLATVITTNQRLEDLDPRIASRLADLDLSQRFEIPAPDYRYGQAGTGSFDRGGRSLSSLALHADQTFESFSPRAGELSDEERENLARALSLARTFAEDPSGWLVFSGAYGCGKTHLAAAIANHQTAKGGPTPMFIVVPDLLDHLRATFSPTSGATLDRVFEQVRTAPLLILDDLGTESATSWAREKLFQLFNHRYAGRLPTVITTTAGIESLDKNEPRLASRMKDTSRCRFYSIIAPSYRGSQAQQAAKRGRPKARG